MSWFDKLLKGSFESDMRKLDEQIKQLEQHIIANQNAFGNATFHVDNNGSIITAGDLAKREKAKEFDAALNEIVKDDDSRD